MKNIVVMCDANPVAVLTEEFSFREWKAWFKARIMPPGDEVVDEGLDYLRIRTQTGAMLRYSPRHTLVNPHEDVGPTYVVKTGQAESREDALPPD